MTVLRPYQQYFSYIRTNSYISGRPFQQYFSYIRTEKVNVSLLPSSQVLSQRQDMGKIPKKETDERRIILALSFPKGSAINDFVSKDLIVSAPYGVLVGAKEKIHELSESAS